MKTTSGIDIGKIEGIYRLQEQAKELNKQIEAMGAAMLTDPDLLTHIFSIYSWFYKRKGREEDMWKVHNRRKFLLITMYLYSPKSLAGAYLPDGIRRKIADLFNLSSSSPISDNRCGLLFSYLNYREFKKEVDELYDEVVRSLKERNLICNA